jgi:hypothetical protein
MEGGKEGGREGGREGRKKGGRAEYLDETHSVDPASFSMNGSDRGLEGVRREGGREGGRAGRRKEGRKEGGREEGA